MSEWSDALVALQSDPELTPEQYEEWLDAGNGKFYAFFRAYGKHIGSCEMKEEIIKLLEETIIKGGNHGWSISTIIGILKEEIKGEK